MSIFVKLVCEALTDAKFLAAGPGAFWIYARGLLYAKQHLTDGMIPDEAMPLVAFGIVDVQVEVNKLLQLKLWESCEGGHRVPEKVWLKYNPRAEVVKALSEKRREAGRRGGRPKKQNESNLVSEESNLQSEKSKNTNSPKPRVQSTEHIDQSTENRAQISPADAGDESVSARSRYSEDFERWYANYPLKAGKAKAAAAFGRAMQHISRDKGFTRDQALDWLCKITATYATSPKGMSGVGAGYPEGWLNGGHYDDDPATWQMIVTPNGTPPKPPPKPPPPPSPIVKNFKPHRIGLD